MIRIDEIDLELPIGELLKLAGTGIGIMGGIIAALGIAKALLLLWI